MEYVRIKDEFDTVELKAVGDEWCISWSKYRGVAWKLKHSLSRNVLDDELNTYSLDDLKWLHNCMTSDYDFNARLNFPFINNFNSNNLIIFNAVVDRLIENETKIDNILSIIRNNK